jgi:hypothetical protein
MQAELEEEWGLRPEELGQGRLLGLVESAAGKPELIWSFHVAPDRTALAARAAAASDAHEAAALLFPAAAPAALAGWREVHRARIAAPTLALLERLVGSP